MTKVIPTLIIGALFSIPAISQETDLTSGNALAKQCSQSSAAFERGFCYGQIHAESTILDLGENRICIPDEVTLGQKIKVVTKYLEDHPEALHLDSTLLIKNALEKAFPCKRGHK